LPADLYRELKEHGLPASQLLQDAVRAEVRRRAAELHTEHYLADLVAEVGEPSPAEWRAARSLAKRATSRRSKAG